MRLSAAWATLAAVALMLGSVAGCSDGRQAESPTAPSAIPLAVLGDSTSQSYQDSVSFPPGSPARGGTYRPATYQWGEVLARLRPDGIDPGVWEISGYSGPTAYLRELIGLPSPRVPRKQDYRYNFATSGAPCHALNEGLSRQVAHLLPVLRAAPAYWAHGVVVVRIGMADIGLPEVMDGLAEEPPAPSSLRVIDACLRHIERATAQIRDTHPQVHVVLVGILNDADDPVSFDKWRDPVLLARIERGLDRYDDGLRALARRSPSMSFFDDRALFRRLWGQRSPDGGTDGYRTVHIGDALAVTNSIGDAPTHAFVADEHLGLAWNALWAQALSEHLHTVAQLPIAPLTDVEVARFVRDALAHGSELQLPKGSGS